MTTINLQQIQKTERLTDAFRIFNELSENLANSYQGLEEQVARLNRELAAARSERVSTLIEKEKLASRLQQILAALPAAVIVLNAGGLVIDCNNHAIDFLGEPLLGEDWQRVMARSLQPVAGSPRERQLGDGRKVNITRNLLSNDAEQIILLSDVSELRSLQDLLAQRKQLSAMGEMVASLAHQVRTPLATAILYASQMSKPTLLEEKRQQFSQKILERLHYLERQVNDMLIFAKQGRLAMQGFSLKQLMTHVSESMEAFEGCLTVDNQLQSDLLLGNEDALRGALLNLLNNAVEAGAERIDFSVRQSDAMNIRIVIEDDGPGIDEQQQTRLFEPFYTTKSHGTGLGLAVVDSVVKAHGGSIVCRSAVGQGTTFTLTLPRGCQYGLGLSAVSSTQENNDEAV
ncbi:MAG: ATP-binding protein [Methylococcaceae bacterium]|nr:ATP-binding protein [Methylococcaceae bacterium]